MIARRLYRYARRVTLRLVCPLRLAYVDYLAKQSTQEIQRLREMRADAVELERNEHFNLVQLEVRKQQIEKGMA